MRADQDADYLHGLVSEIRDWWPRLCETVDARTAPPARVRTFGALARSETHDCGTPWAHAADSTPERPRVYCPSCTGASELGARAAYLRAPAAPVTLAGSPAPLRVSALDAVQTVHGGLVALEVEVRAALGDSARPAPGQAGDPAAAAVLQACLYLGRQAPRIVTLDSLAWAVDEVRRLVGVLRGQVGTAHQVRAIAGPCPICGSWGLRAYTGREMIVCTNPACRCEKSGCSCAGGRPHTWRFSADPRRDEWARLSLVLDVDLYGLLAEPAETQPT